MSTETPSSVIEKLCRAAPLFVIVIVVGVSALTVSSVGLKAMSTASRVRPGAEDPPPPDAVVPSGGPAGVPEAGGGEAADAAPSGRVALSLTVKVPTMPASL